jgi:c-di-GMP-binding flagellar brake protein YcgR
MIAKPRRRPTSGGENRRAFARVDTEIPLEFSSQSGERTHDGLIANLGGGGLLFGSNVDVPARAIIVLDFKLDRETRIRGVRGTVVETTRRRLYDFRHVTRVRFEDIGFSQQDRIMRYVFARQTKRARGQVLSPSALLPSN